MGSFLTENFPTRIRSAGQGFTYNFGRGVTALNPTLIGMAAANMGLGHAIAILAAGSYTLVLLVTFLLPETRGKTLSAD